jgi:phage shock protein PspC (stress-responsive transcriptional regulator)
MEPIAGQPADAARAAAAPSSTSAGTGEKARTESHGHKRLYQIREGGMIGGVCLGLATFLNIDVTVIRILFVLFAVATGGWGFLMYGALMFILPRATTREQAATTIAGDAANQPQWPWDRDGWPWDRDGWPWDRHGWPWDRDERRQWRHEQRAARWRYGGGSPVPSALVIVFFVMLAFGWLSFWTRGGDFVGWPFFWGGPFFWGFPHWFGIVIFFLAFRFLLMPLRFYGPYSHTWLAIWQGTIWLGTMIFVVWLAYHYIPEVHDFIQQFRTDWSDRSFGV